MIATASVDAILERICNPLKMSTDLVVDDNGGKIKFQIKIPIRGSW